ncbi:MAG TPA: sulfurtransferase [Thermoprotei archaeon]|nr:sulfurtransferase [Thermoprotei archaeon]
MITKIIEPQELRDLLGKGEVKVIEVDYDPSTAYELGHIPGALLIDWKRDLNKYPERDIIDPEGFEKLMSRLGISNDDLVVLYGDYNNWFATFALWVFDLYGHDNAKILNGGRNKWIDLDYPMTKEVPNVTPSNYKIARVDLTRRATFLDVMRRLRDPNVVLVDVRSPAEYKGEVTAPPEYPNEAAQRGGHIPGAINIPWAKAVNDDGTLKPIEELRKLYSDLGVTPDKDIIIYCRIGERAAFTYFVLHHLLGYDKIKVYDGSWSEWGNLVGAPIETDV